MNRFQFVDDHSQRYGVKRLCRVLGIARSSFYHWQATAPVRAARQAADIVLATRIRAVHTASDGTYSVPRITAELRDNGGEAVNHKRVARVMRGIGLQGLRLRRRVRTTIPDAAAVQRALGALADALRPGGVLALDMCDLEWGAARTDAVGQGRVGDDWAIITRFSQPSPDRFDREITTFVRQRDGSYRRDDEHHRNVLLDTATVPALLQEHGVTATVGRSFNDEDHPLPIGLMSIIGHRKSPSTR